MLQNIRKWKWVATAVLCFLLVNVLPSSFIERYYSRGFFLLIRNFFDKTLGQLPFPAYYLFLTFIIIIVLNWLLHFFREKPQPILERLFRILSFAGFMTTLFFILWGFNYGRIPLEKSLSLNIQPLNEQQLMEETNTTVDELQKIRIKIQKDTAPIPEIVFINNIEENSRAALNACLSGFHYTGSDVRGRFMFEDFFLVFNIGGQYMPYIGEGNVDDAVYYSKKPFYLVHEMAHGNGFTGEADCNFLGYASCVQSNKLSLRYSGELNYLLYLLPELHARDSLAYNAMWDGMPAVVRKDLLDLKAYQKKHSFKTGFIGEVINNLYLKMMGVHGGTKNYDRMVLLIYAWKNKHGI
jgi:hypothetical protein